MRPRRNTIRTRLRQLETLESRNLLAGDPPVAVDDAFDGVEDTPIVVENRLQQTIETFSVTGGDLDYVAFDAVGEMFYVSQPSRNRVIPINPLTRETGEPISVPGQPGKLRVTDNGQYLYVAANGAGRVIRIDLATQEIDQNISLGADKYAEDLEPLPGLPKSIAVAISTKGISPRGDRVAIYDNGTARPLAGHAANTIEVSEDGTRLYGYLSELSNREIKRMEISQEGLKVNKVLGYTVLLDGMELMGDRLYFDDGHIIDTDLELVGTLERPHFMSMVPLPSRRIAGLAEERDTIVIYDGQSQTRVDTIRIDGRPWAHHGVEIDHESLAFVDDNDLYWVRSDRLSGVTRHDIMANDFDAEGDELTPAIVTPPANGVVDLNPDGTFTYTPNANFFGEDQFTYKVNDGTSDSEPATVSLIVRGTNDAPTAEDDIYFAGADENFVSIPASEGLLANDVDPEGDALTAELVDLPSLGGVSISPDGSFRFLGTPPIDQFTYRVFDGQEYSETATVTVVHADSPNNPLGIDDAYSVDEEQTLEVDTASGVLANDLTPTGNPLMVEIAASPTHGQLELAADGSFVYTPEIDYAGEDQFTYRAIDGVATSVETTVVITINNVNDRPQANADHFDVLEDESLSIGAEPGLLANDLDVDGDELSVRIVSSTTYGELSLNDDGSFDYVPERDFFGVDEFEYWVSDGDLFSGVQKVTLNVTAVPEAPVVRDDQFTVEQGTSLTVDAAPGTHVRSMNLPVADVAYQATTDSLLVTIDAPGHARDDTITSINPYNLTVGNAIQVDDKPSQIAVSVDGKSLHVVVGGDRAIQFYDFETGEVFDAVFMPGRGEDARRVESFIPVPDQPGHVAVSLEKRRDEAGGVLVMHRDETLRRKFDDGGPNILAFDVATDTVLGYQNWLSSFDFWYLDIDDNGITTRQHLPWSPVLTGYDVKVMQAHDSVLYTNRGEILNYERTIELGTFAGGENFLIAPDEHRLFSLAASEPDPLEPADAPRHHTLHIYDLNTRALLGTEMIEGVIGETFGLTRFGTSGLAFGTTGGQLFTIEADRLFGVSAKGVLRNDTDADGDTLTATLVDGPTNGELELLSDGTFTYRPESDFVGTDRFTYVANDGQFVSEPITVTLTVGPAQRPGEAVDDLYVLPLGAARLDVDAENGILSNDEEGIGGALTATIATEPTHGTVSLNDDGSFRYVPGPTFVLSDSFEYTATDGFDRSTGRVQIELDVPKVFVGDVNLRPNTPNQQIPILVEGTTEVSGVNFYVQIGDGGPELSDFGVAAGVDGPSITSIDLTTETIFAGTTDAQIDQPGIPQVAITALALSNDEERVVANGRLATVTIDTTGFFEGSWDLRIADVLPFAELSGPFSTDFAGIPTRLTNGTLTIAETAVVGRHLIYDGSLFGDEVAPDKHPLLPGQRAGFANYSSYANGINGLAIDIANTLEPLTENDFEFRVGRSSDLTTWQAAPATSAFVREVGAGTDGADRYRFRWNDHEIENEWLEVRVLASERAGLVTTDRFYFGSAPGDTGDNATNAIVNATDVIATRDNKRGPFDPAPIDDRYDFNRDGQVNATDVVFARDHITSPFTALPMLNLENETEDGLAPNAVAAALDAQLLMNEPAFELDHKNEGRRGRLGLLFEAEPDKRFSVDWSRLKRGFRRGRAAW